MKRTIFLAAIAVLATISCTKNETISTNQDAITLKTYTAGATKVSEALITDLQGSGFTLYSYRTSDQATAGDAFGTVVSAYINGKAATYSTGWSVANGPYYWPANSDYLQFFGVNYPGTWTAAATATWPKFSYTVKAVASQEDLMACNTLNRQGSMSTDVALVFKHILAQINFAWKGVVNTGNLLTYKINSITIKNVGDAATFTFNGNGQVNEAGTKIVPGDWTAPATVTASYAYNLTGVANAEQVESTGNAKSLKNGSASNGLMLLPQSFSGAATAVIEVNYTVTDASGNQIFNGTKSVSLASTDWVAGSKVNYLLNLPTGADPITFTVTVAPWNNETSTTVNY